MLIAILMVASIFAFGFIPDYINGKNKLDNSTIIANKNNLGSSIALVVTNTANSATNNQQSSSSGSTVQSATTADSSSQSSSNQKTQSTQAAAQQPTPAPVMPMQKMRVSRAS